NELFGVMKFRPALTKGFRHFYSKTCGQFDITFLACSRCRTRYRSFARDGDANYWCVGTSSRLHDAVQMKDTVPSRGNVLCSNCEHRWQTARDILLNSEQVLANTKDITLLDGGRDGNSPRIDDSVASGCIHRQYCFHALIYEVSVLRDHVHR